ncbi:hypothetical protein JTB14_009265 [Gonioctena quinquepunctata]|nr:hypothetical protein JTB14_009265 [Gonioctena quinquepunctata]
MSCEPGISPLPKKCSRKKETFSDFSGYSNDGEVKKILNLSKSLVRGVISLSLKYITYVVVEFCYNNTLFISAAPEQWVKENACWWPSKKDKERKLIRDAIDPENDWTLLKDVTILGHYATYKEALYNEGKLAKTDLESDGDSNSCIEVIQKRRKNQTENIEMIQVEGFENHGSCNVCS